MREPRQQTLVEEEQTLVVGGEETTLVAPRFDDEETLVARPVVPFEAGEVEAAPELTPNQPAPLHARSYAPRRSWMLALMLVSVLVGGVLGGAGLYLYQRQSQDPAVTPAAATQTPAEVKEQPAAPDAEPPARQTAAPHTEETAAPAPAEEAPAREAESVPAAERRDAAAPKRGKKDDRDEEIERRTTTPPARNVARAEQPEARKVDTIFYRQRRAERRARRGGDVDRLRRIFEGDPE